MPVPGEEPGEAGDPCSQVWEPCSGSVPRTWFFLPSYRCSCYLLLLGASHGSLPPSLKPFYL